MYKQIKVMLPALEESGTRNSILLNRRTYRVRLGFLEVILDGYLLLLIGLFCLLIISGYFNIYNKQVAEQLFIKDALSCSVLLF
jgi:hypothetical protein